MRLLAIDCTGHDPELIADRCWQAGAAGIWEVDDTTLRAGVEDEAVDAFVAAVGDLTPVDVTDVEAVVLAGRWSTVTIASRDVELWVPPTVFGDGHHPTTATCLELLAEHVRAGSSVLDVGCGAGALSIGAALAGGTVTAIDLDPEAVAATRSNAARAGVRVTTLDRPLSALAGPFDVVVANMTTGALGPLVGDLVRCCGPGGVVIVSGLLGDQWPAVETALGGAVVTVLVVEGWLSAVVAP